MRASPFSKESASLSKVRFCKNLPPKSARLGRSLTTLRPWRKGESEARGASQSIWGLDGAMVFLFKSQAMFPPHQMGKNGHLVVKWFFITLLLWICQREKGWRELWLTGHTQRNPPTCWDFFHKFMNNLRKTWFKNMWPSCIGVCWWRIQWGF